MKRWKNIFGSRALRNAEGSEIAEMAMVLPVMFLVFLGIFWAGRMYNIYATVNQAARLGARVASQSNCSSCGDTPGADGAVDTAVSNSIQADRLNPASITAPNPVPSPNGCPPAASATCTVTTHNISVCRNALVTPTTVSPPVCGVLVEFTYQMDLGQITIPFAGGSGTLPSPRIAARAQMAVEQ
jgi:Flp pilus assembly protein TadG